MPNSRPNRRTFLATVVAGAIASGCASDEDATDGNDSSGSTLPKATESSTTPATVVPAPSFDKSPFALGVASGDPDDSSVILWTRLVLDPLVEQGGLPADLGDVEVMWEVAKDDGFGDLVASGIGIALSALGHSVHVEASGLDSDTWYYYRFTVGDHISTIARTRTTASAGTDVDQLKIAFASCQMYTNGYYTAYDQMAQDDLDLVFFLGDYIYEYPGDSVRRIDGEEAQSIEDYRRLYSIYKADASLQAAHAAAPWVLTWDDHEVENNHAGLANDGELSEADFATRRAAAYQAYYEFQPLRLPAPEGPDWEIYRTIRHGSLAEFFVLDGRQYRDDQPCDGQDTIVPIDKCTDLSDERTMLGTQQESWLESGLAESDATWKALAQQTVMSSLVLGPIVLNVDQWDGYPQARQRLLDSIESNAVENVIVMTGDIHTAGAGVLQTDAGTDVATEFVCTSITSPSLVDRVPGGADLVTPDAFEGIEYLNVRDHGYCRATITSDEWVTEYVIVSTITEPTAVTSVDATLSVSAGSPALLVE